MKIDIRIKHVLQAFVKWAMACDGETKKMLSMILRHSSRDAHILDVGCGYGRNLRALRTAGFLQVMGVEKNSKIIKAVRKEGYICFDIEEFTQTSYTFDVILMSHVIEHFSPDDLLVFIDSYLDRLVPGGKLVIATPLIGDCFFDDFDHIKPYMPTGIMNVFGKSGAQVQFFSRNRLELSDLWFRRGYHKFVYYRAAYIKTRMTWLLRLINVVSALIFRASLGWVGKTDGWVGVFKKC